ncbi:iron ABC transporter ATP-binding protein [Azorhizobium oxalatiphilum]|uniref:Iron ABC transporter ATP-binding protein n=1 Tax=Azorhizobium oxalatiphilum TaxID=980631 RepID=A0A917BNF9_9HYPH|nr:ABC transporter ATP-binding protein [Azorhizobium oxalatiphilum]GGF50762.1 iron ABC transporter ATP-binding protein [Azorhizobium oxalatiphilum]
MTGLKISGLSAGYGRRPIVKAVSLPALGAGQVMALVGPNGAGKSTLMRAIVGLVPATGAVEFDGTDLLQLRLRERARRVAYMPQTLPGGIGLTVLEGVLTALRASPDHEGLPRSTDARQALATLVRFGIGHLASERMDRLSGGQRQLAALAQAAVRMPPLLLLDEPTSALDLAHQVQVMRCIRSYAEIQGAVVVIVLHDLELACRWADAIAVLKDGALAAFGSPEQAITPDTLRQAYGVEARIDRDAAGRIRVLVEDAL